MKVPGIVYSLLLAVGAWAIDYFTTGDGSSIPWGPILVAAIPVIIKTFTVQTSTTAEPASNARGLPSYEEHMEAKPGKVRSWLLG